MTRLLGLIGRFGQRRALPIVLIAGGLLGVSVVGVGKIEINDNPVKWFSKSHPLRTADRVMNERFGGTYMAYLALDAGRAEVSISTKLESLSQSTPNGEIRGEFDAKRLELKGDAEAEQLRLLETFVDDRESESDGALADQWGELGAAIADASRPDRAFQSPALLEYLRGYQKAAIDAGLVGNSTSIADIAAVVNRELHGGEDSELKIPATHGAVSQALLAFESSHRPQLLWHFVTPDFTQASLWLQLKKGDNQNMESLVSFTSDYFESNPPPLALSINWFGLTYLNAVWQQKMVGGMTTAILGSVLIILLLMTVLLRSALWGLISLVPFLVSILVIYGAVGFVGKAYDMPVAVLSCLTLGLAVDFAIHFTVRARALYRDEGGWTAARKLVFGAPARAITRNGLVVAIGFAPLLVAPLTPYRTVGVLLAAILLLSAVSCLLVLPAIITLLEPFLFRARSNISIVTLFVIAATIGGFAAVAAPALFGAGLWPSAASGVALGAVVALFLYRSPHEGNAHD